MQDNIFEAVDNYIDNLFAPEDDALKAVIRSLDEENIPQMSVSANQGKFLQLMATLCNAKRILEVGTLGGYSTIWLARALPEDGKVVTLEVNAAYAEVAKANIERAGVSGKVEIRVGKAIDMLPQMIENGEAAFDLIFIDADKPPYTEYFQYALKLSRPGTMIIADNVVRGGKILDKNSTDAAVLGVQRFNKMLAENEEVIATVIQNVGVKEHDGMAMAVVRRK